MKSGLSIPQSSAPLRGGLRSSLLKTSTQRPEFAPFVARARPETNRLLSLLTNEEATTSEINEALEPILNGDIRVKYSEKNLQGKWRVAYTKGTFLWESLTGPRKVRQRGQDGAYQDFNVPDRTVINSADVFNGAVSIFGEGFYEVPESLAKEPKKKGGLFGFFGAKDEEPQGPIILDFTAERGFLVLNKSQTKIPLPISGKGNFEVVYLDPPLRVFRSPITGSVSVQVRVDRLS